MPSLFEAPAFICSLFIGESLLSKESILPAAAAYADMVNLVALLPRWDMVKAVFLPLGLDPSALHPPELGSLRNQLLKICKAQGIDIGWQSDPFGAENTETFCIDFLEHAKELKAKQEAEAE